MIEAVVLTVEEDAPPPPDLLRAWWCGDTRLPDNGAVHDQDWPTLHRMRAAENVWRTLVRLRGLSGEEIHSLTTAERKIIKYLRDEKLI